jgi:putative heme-binding domain-containing protein
MEGDPEAGKALFFDADSPAGCAKCHRVGGQGGSVGPELTGLAGRQPPDYILESILFPSKVIASGYEPVLVKTKDGRFLNGVLRRNDATGVTFVDKDGKTVTVPKADIEVADTKQPSLMPGNFAEVLTVKDLHDLLAYVQSLK